MNKDRCVKFCGCQRSEQLNEQTENEMLRARCPELKTHNKVQRGTEKKQGHAVGRHTETGLGRTVLLEKFTQSKAINVQHALDLRQPQRVIQIANPNTSFEQGTQQGT